MAKGLVAVFFTLVLSLLGCGGAGTTGTLGNPGAGSTTGQAQGVYSGTSSAGAYFETIVLPNDRMYALYGTVSGNVFYVYGMISGQGSSNNGSFTASTRDFYLDNIAISGTVNASYVVGTSFNGTLNESGSVVTFNGTPLTGTNYNYNTAAQVSSITGLWMGQVADGSSATVTINSDGTFSGSNLGCSFSGTVTPDASGKNFYNVTMNFGASPCLLANQTASGIAVYYLLSDGITHELIFGGVSGNYGSIFLAAR